MERHSRRRAMAGVTWAGAIAVLLALPMFSSAGLLEDVQRETEQPLSPVRETLDRALTPPAQQVQRAPRPAQTPGQGTYQPPAHGTVPNGQGSVGVIDIQPSEARPLSGDPTGAGDAGQAREEVIVGRARGEQEADGTYHGHITIVSLFGNEVAGVDTQDGQTAAGPLDALQQGTLDPLCTGSTICLEVLAADSATTSSGSTNRFAVATARVGDPTAPALSARAAESNGNISSDGSCQTAHGDSTVADADLGGAAVADVSQSSTDSRACSDGTQTQSNGSSVIGLGGTGVPIPVAGCADGTPDSAFTPLAPLASIVCNADDSAGTGEAVAQTGAPYGVREALSVFALEAGGTSLAKATTAAAESHAVAPAGPITPPGPDLPDESGPGGPGTEREEARDRDDGDGSARDRGAPDTAGVTARGDGGELPVTGAELLLIALLGAVTLAGGLALRRTAERWEGRSAA